LRNKKVAEKWKVIDLSTEQATITGDNRFINNEKNSHG
jgi:hypothetical protein